MFEAGPAPKSIGDSLLEPGLYGIEIQRAKAGEGWYSLHVEVVEADDVDSVGLRTVMFLTDPSQKFDEKEEKAKALEKMQHMGWACNRQGFKKISELVGDKIVCKVSKYSYTNGDGEEVEKNGFFPQLPTAAKAASGW